MPIKFKEAVKHGTNTFPPTVALAFEDDRAEEYFVAAGWAEQTDDDPIMAPYPEGTVTIDPDTVFAGTANKVLEG